MKQISTTVEPFQSVFALYEMQTISCRMWTRVAVSISNDGNYYTTNAFIFHSKTYFFNSGDVGKKNNLFIKKSNFFKKILHKLKSGKKMLNKKKRRLKTFVLLKNNQPVPQCLAKRINKRWQSYRRSYRQSYLS